MDYEGDDDASQASDRTAKAGLALEARDTDQVLGQTLREEPLCPEDRRLAAALAGQFVRRQEFGGSDVRLDIGLLFRPDAFPRTSINPRRSAMASGPRISFSQRRAYQCPRVASVDHGF